jgi:hypothetical protein
MPAKHSWLEDMLAMLTATGLISLGIVFFNQPGLVVGGTAGLALLLHKLLPLSFGQLFFMLNVLILLSVFVIIAVMPLFLSKREVTAVENIKKERVTVKDILSFFREKGKLKQILILIFYYSGIIGIMAMLKPYLVDLGYSVKDIAFMSGIFGTLTAACSTLLGGFIMRNIGRRSAMFLFLTF